MSGERSAVSGKRVIALFYGRLCWKTSVVLVRCTTACLPVGSIFIFMPRAPTARRGAACESASGGGGRGTSISPSFFGTPPPRPRRIPGLTAKCIYPPFAEPLRTDIGADNPFAEPLRTDRGADKYHPDPHPSAKPPAWLAQTTPKLLPQSGSSQRHTVRHPPL